MDSIFNNVCVLVTAVLALTLVPGFRRSQSSLLSMRDRGIALLVFMVLGLVEQAAVGRSSWFNHRIVAVCAAGLLAGPGVGVVVAVFGTWMAVAFDGRLLVICGLSMLSGGLAGQESPERSTRGLRELTPIRKWEPFKNGAQRYGS